MTAMWLLGNAAADNGDNAKAVDYWQRAYPLLDDEPAMQAELGQMISQAGGKPPVRTASLPPIMGSEGTAATPPASDGTVTRTAPGSPSSGTGTGHSRTRRRPAIPCSCSPAPSGPPIPLAVARHQVSELPLTVT